MTIYRVTLDVESKMLPTILTSIDGNHEIKLIAVTDASAPSLPPALLPPQPPAQAERKASRRFAGGKRIKAVRGEDVIMNVLSSSPASMDELRRAFQHHEYSPNSVPSYVSRMIKAGRIKRALHGRFALTNGASS
jgi:hypothetical protein